VLFTEDEEIRTIQSINSLPHLIQYNASAAAKYKLVKSVLVSSKVMHPSKATANKWHLRFGHLKEEALRKAVQQHVGIIIEGDIKLLHCKACTIGLSKRKFLRISTIRPSRAYTELSVDIIMPITTGIGSVR